MENQTQNTFESSSAGIIRGIGGFIIVISILAGIVLGVSDESFFVFIVYAAIGTVCGLLFVGLAEIIDLLRNCQNLLIEMKNKAYQVYWNTQGQ